MLLPATLLLLAFNVQHSGSSRLFSPSFHLGDRPGYWFDGREILLQGNVIKDLSLLELWKYLFASHHFEINKKSSLFNKKISGGNQNRKKNNLFYCSPQSWQSIAKNTHHTWRIQVSEEWKLSYSLDACTQGLMDNLTVWTSTPASVMFILAPQEHNFFSAKCLFHFDHKVKF